MNEIASNYLIFAVVTSIQIGFIGTLMIAAQKLFEQKKIAVLKAMPMVRDL